MILDKLMSFDIYLVSLEKDTKRRNFLENRFLNFYNSFKYYPAIDGRLLLSKEYYEKILINFKKNKKLMSPGEVGCTLSHISVLSKFLESDSKYALVFEDDIIGCDEDIEKIGKIIPYLSENSLVICGGQDGLLSRYFQLGKNTKSNPDLYLLHPHSYQYVYRTCCYLVTRKSASMILDYHHNNLAIADHWGEIFKESKINFYYTDIFKHPLDLADSSIEAERLAPTSSRKFWHKLKSIKYLKKIFISFLVTSLLLLCGYKRLN